MGYENGLTDALSWVGYTSLGFFTLAFLILLTRDGLWLVTAAGGKTWSILNSWLNQEGLANVPIDPSRRQFFVSMMNLGIVSLTGGLSAYGFFQARRNAQLKHIKVPIRDLPAELEGFRIVQISDLHVGPTIKRDFVRKVVDDVHGLNPDLIAITGDLVDGSVDHLSDDVAPLADLTAPHGKYFVTGNHEYYSGVDHWIREVERLGFKNLLNEHEVRDVAGAKLTVAGVTDLHAHQIVKEHRTSPRAALENAPKDSIKLLLAHQPGSIHEAQQNGAHLQLSGHTHGGQFKPFNLAVSRAHPYVQGLHDHKGTWIYVNAGTGYWGPPLRIGVPSELTVLELTAAEKSAAA